MSQQLAQASGQICYVRCYAAFCSCPNKRSRFCVWEVELSVPDFVYLFPPLHPPFLCLPPGWKFSLMWGDIVFLHFPPQCTSAILYNHQFSLNRTIIAKSVCFQVCACTKCRSVCLCYHSPTKIVLIFYASAHMSPIDHLLLWQSHKSVRLFFTPFFGG